MALRGSGAPQSTSQDRSQVIGLSKSVRVRVWETVPVGDAFQLQHVGNRDVGKVVFQYVLSGDLRDLSIESKSDAVERNIDGAAYIPIELELCAVECGIEYTSWAPAKFVTQWDVRCLWCRETAAERSER